MPVSYQLPTQSRFISTSNIFEAAFNVPTPGKYDFTNTAANQNVLCIDLQPNTVYFIDKISVSGNITEEQFLESINAFPYLYVKKNIRKENVYEKPIAIANYYDGNECSAWVFSDKFSDQLIFTFEGVFNQLPSMVGLAAIRLQISMNIFAIESSYYNGAFRDQLATSIGQRNRS